MKPEQALALIEAMLGEELHEYCGSQKAPHVMTHLEAVLGRGQVPTVRDVSMAVQGHESVQKCYREEVERSRKALYYLKDAISTLTVLLPESEEGAI